MTTLPLRVRRVGGATTVSDWLVNSVSPVLVPTRSGAHLIVVHGKLSIAFLAVYADEHHAHLRSIG